MIAGIGLDSVEIDRFSSWHTYRNASLSRIFSAQEIEYCCENPGFSSGRFAVRFAAREAFFKAISQAVPGHIIPFFTMARAATIVKEPLNPAPFLTVNWELLIPYLPLENITQLSTLKLFASLTHTKTIASAMVIIEKPDMSSAFV